VNAIRESGEAFPSHLTCLFVKFGLGRSTELRAKAFSLGAQFVEFREEAEILPKLSEVLGIEYVGTKDVPSVPESRPAVPLAPVGPIEKKPNANFGSAHSQIITISVAKTRPKKDQPRKHFNKSKLLALGRSLLYRQYVPIIVVCVFGDPDCFYQIEDGERRWRACQMVGKQTLEAIIAKDVSEAESFKRSAICNFGREGHQPMEIAEALHRMRREDPSMTIKRLADVLANSEGWVNFHLGLLKLVDSVRELLNPELPDEERLSTTAAHEISKLPVGSQLSAARCVLKHQMSIDQARHYIRHLMVRVGTSNTSSRKRGPTDDYRILQTFLRRSEESLDRLLDFPGGLTLENLFRHRSSSDAENVLESIERIITKLEKTRAQVDASSSPIAKGREDAVLVLASKK
jgi:ParB family chromosome partitioning protein